MVALLALVGAISGAGKKSTTPTDRQASSSGSVTTQTTEPTTTQSVESADTADTSTDDNGSAAVSLVASKSFCVFTGIDDAFTGNGHVVFFLTFHNSGNADGSTTVVPVRHYTDGAMNESGMDMFTVDVPAGRTVKVHTDQMIYKAHEHEIEACGLLLDGNDEVGITSTHL